MIKSVGFRFPSFEFSTVHATCIIFASEECSNESDFQMKRNRIDRRRNGYTVYRENCIQCVTRPDFLRTRDLLRRCKFSFFFFSLFSFSFSQFPPFFNEVDELPICLILSKEETLYTAIFLCAFIHSVK